MSYQVIHSTLGRYRIRVPQLANDSDFADKLKTLVKSLGFVTEVSINAPARSLIISYEINAISSTTALEKFARCIDRVNSIEIPFEEPSLEGSDLKPEVNESKDLGLPFLSLSLALLAVPFEIPPLIVVLALVGAAMPWFNRASDSLLNHHQPNIDLLDSAWMTLQATQGQYVAPALKTTMVEMRRTLRGKTTHIREEQSLNLLSELDQYVWVELNGQEQRIRASELQVGERIIIKPGEMILVDGLILYGWGLVDMQNFTSSPTPLVCSQGQQVYASTVLLEGELNVLVKRIGANTCAGLAALLAKLTPVHDTKIGAQQAELVRNMVMPTLALGGMIYLMTGNLGAAISPYQLDFCSGIPISISTTVIQALTYAAQNGVYIRSGRVLELLAEIDAIVFDINALAVDSPETVEAIATLRRQKIDTYFITSDPQETTLDVAGRLGIHPDYTCAEALLNQKINLVRGLQHQGKTIAFVGEEEDDTVRFAHANVSIVFAKTSDISHTTADVVILEDDLRGVIHAIAIARRAMEVVYQNTATILVPNLFMQIGGGIFLGLNPILNVIVNNSTAFISEFLNDSRPLFEPNFLPPLRSSCQQSIQEKLEYSSLHNKALISSELAKPSAVTEMKPESP